MTAPADRAATVRHGLAPLAPFINAPEVTEICANGPGRVFLFANGAWSESPVPEMTEGRLLLLASAAAAWSSNPFGPESPILSATLPGGLRAQFVRPPAVAAGALSLTIRKPSLELLTLRDYESGPFFADAPAPGEGPGEAELARHFERFRDPDPQVRAAARGAFLRAAVRERRNIVIAGETGSGKTTFMKALMQEIPETERILTIEDVPELRFGLPRHRNQANLFYPSEARDGDPVTAASLLRSALRMKPDRILIAELRGGETFDFLTACLSGHGGSITSCHAGSCAEAIDCLVLRALQSEAGSRLPEPALRRLVLLASEIVVHVTARGGARRADEIAWNRKPATAGALRPAGHTGSVHSVLPNL